MKINTDTGSLITQERAKQLGITLFPLQVAIDGNNYRDYFDISAHDFIELTKTSIPVSSQPAVGEVIDSYEDMRETLHITMTTGLSATYDSAFGIIQSSDIKHVTLFNSKTLAGTQQYLVELAVKLKEDNTIPEIVERMEYCLQKCQSFLVPEDFDYLKRGGRLSPIAATLGGLIRIKPIVTQTEGSLKLERFGFGRNWKRTFKHIIDKMIENGVNEKFKIYISHAENEAAATLAHNQIKDSISNCDVEILELSPGMITQGGPGCVAIQYILKDPLVD